MTVSYHEAVHSDLSEGRNFYDRQSPGVGDYFLESVLADAESLAHCAGIHSQHFGYFRLLGKTFPFGIYYLMEEDRVIVHAILDMRREPSWMRKELEGRS